MNLKHPTHRSFQFIFFLLYLLPSLLPAQGMPFQVQLDDQPGIQTVADILVNETDDIVMLMVDYIPTRYQFIRVDGTVGPVQALEFGYVVPTEQSLGFVRDACLFGDKAFFLNDIHSLLSGIDLTTGEKWSRRMPYGRYSSMTPYGDSSLIVVTPSQYSDCKVGIYRIGLSGELLMKHGLIFDTPQLQQDVKNILAVDSKVDAEGNTYFVGKFLINHDTITEDGPTILVKLDPQGNPIKWKAISGLQFHQLYLADDAVFLLDKSSNNIQYNLNPNSYTYLSTVDESKAKLLKFDHDLNLLWGKTYQGENYDYITASIQQTSTGRLIMAHSTFGAFPVVLTELDGAGNILSQKGYPNYQPFLRVLSDGSLLLCSSITDETGGIATAPVITRTDTLGNTTGCPTFPTCLYAKDFWIETDTLLVTSFEPPPPDTTISVTYPITVSFSPYCDYPPVPVPDFELPDTLCLSGSATTHSEGNRLAQAREWHLTGPNGIDSLLQDSFEFSYRFDTPGEYLLQQAVWVLGCRYDYERSITVLPPLTVAIVGDSIICPDEPQEISAEANRAASYTWSNGSASAILPLSVGGTYTVTVTDGTCTATATATIDVVAELLNGSPPFQLPPDMTICNRDLPFLLVPKSLFADIFTLGNNPMTATNFQLDEPGAYKVGMEAFGCEFEQTFQLMVECHAKVYVPNSFSPNGDGINDVFQPFGTDFEVLELSIFDRWGGLMHLSKGIAAGWDGEKATQGVYAYKLIYHDLLSLKTEVLEGDVLLVR